MEAQKEVMTETCNAFHEDAKTEPPFPAQDLLQEIAPLLEDYFVTEIQAEENALVLRFPNGQKFKLSAEEIS